MDRVTCPFIKRNGSICGGVCTRLTGCARHWKLYEKNMKKRPCLVCGFPTDADLEYCAKYCSKYSAKYHAHNYRMRQKYIAETGTLQLAKTSELSDETPQPTETSELSDETPQPTETFELSDVTFQSRIYEAPVSESDDEDMGLDLFGD